MEVWIKSGGESELLDYISERELQLSKEMQSREKCDICEKSFGQQERFRRYTKSKREFIVCSFCCILFDQKAQKEKEFWDRFQHQTELLYQRSVKGV